MLIMGKVMVSAIWKLMGMVMGKVQSGASMETKRVKHNDDKDGGSY